MMENSVSLLLITGDRSDRKVASGWRRSSIYVFLVALAVMFSLLGGVIAPAVFPGVPTPVVLLMTWMISSVPPTTGAVCVLVAMSALGIFAQGLMRGLALAACSTAGYVAILVLVAVHPINRKAKCSKLWGAIAWILRMPSEFFVQVMWSVPRTITLPVRAPLAFLLDLMAAEMCIVGEAIIRVSEALGCGFGEGAAGDGETLEERSKTPVIFVHGLNSSRAIWLVGILFLRARAKHLGALVTVRYRAKEGDGMNDLAAALREKVLSECESLQASRVILVGHSLGGVLCAMIAESLSKGQAAVEVDSVVCISAPWRKRQEAPSNPAQASCTRSYTTSSMSALHDGMVGLGGFIGGRMRQDLGEGGMVEEVGEKLLHRGEWGGRIFNLGGQLDPLVIRSTSLVCVAAFRTCMAPHLAHLSSLLSYTVWGQVLVWIDREHKKGESKLHPAFGASAGENV